MSLPPERLTKSYTRMLHRHERAERELARAMNRWNKTRLALRRYEKRIDQLALADDEAQAAITEARELEPASDSP